MSEKSQKALELFDSGFNCCQAVIGTFVRQFGIDEQFLMKLACGFGGGLRRGEVCGAVSGVIMVVGLKYGQYIANDLDSKKKCYEITTKIYGRILKKKGNCSLS